MKKLIKTLVLVISFSFLPVLLMSQNPPHPNGGSGPGSGNTPVGGGAPLDGGLIIMMAIGSVYAVKKTVAFRKAK